MDIISVEDLLKGKKLSADSLVPKPTESEKQKETGVVEGFSTPALPALNTGFVNPEPAGVVAGLSTTPVPAVFKEKSELKEMTKSLLSTGFVSPSIAKQLENTFLEPPTQKEAVTPTLPSLKPLGSSPFEIQRATLELARLALVTEEKVIEILTLYGEKNDGKTHFALSFPGTISALSFDQKTARIWKNNYNSDPRIQVWDARMLESSYDGISFQESSVENFKLINLILDLIEERKPDWILIDGLEKLQEICEQMMRVKNNFKPFQGVEWTYWKERKIYLRQIHSRIIRIAKRGVIYTTYVEVKELNRKDGKVVESKQIPKYIDMILQETDDTIRLSAEFNNQTQRTQYFAMIEGSKGTFSIGERQNVTGKGIEAFKDFAKLVK